MDPRCRRKWTPKEDSILRSEVGAHQTSSPINWTAISTKLPGRNNKDCRKRWFKMADAYRKGPWTEDEDQRLLQAISTCGTRWNQVTQHVGTRNADQCAKRWQHSLDPSIDRSPWTVQDDEALLSAVLEQGRAWRLITSTKFPFRSPTDLKNRYELVCRRLQDTGKIQSSAQHQHHHHALPDFDDLMNLESLHHNPEYTPSDTGGIQPVAQHHHELPDLDGLMDVGSFHHDAERPFSDPGMVNPSSLFPLTPESELSSSVGMFSCSQRSKSLSNPTNPPPCSTCNNSPPSAASSPSYTLIVENVDPASVGDVMQSLVERGLMLDIRLQRQINR